MISSGFLSPAERRELEVGVRSQREDHGVARRANAILLLDDGKPRPAIAEFLYLDDDTIRGWYKTYCEAGWDALSIDGWKGGVSRLTAIQEAELCDWLVGRFCRSTVEIRARISKNDSGPSCTNASPTIATTQRKSSSRMRSSGSFEKPYLKSGKPSNLRCQTTSGSSHMKNFRFWAERGIASFI